MILIDRDDPARPDVRVLLEEHLSDMFATSPAESVHALDLDALRHRSVEFFTARDDQAAALLGCAALKRLAPTWCEVKSMRTVSSARGRGVAAALLEHLVGHAERGGVLRLSLETGAEDYFAPARRLYERHGFLECPPFGDYRPDRHSVFYTRALGPVAPQDPTARVGG